MYYPLFSINVHVIHPEIHHNYFLKHILGNIGINMILFCHSDFEMVKSNLQSHKLQGIIVDVCPTKETGKLNIFLIKELYRMPTMYYSICDQNLPEIQNYKYQ